MGTSKLEVRKHFRQRLKDSVGQGVAEQSLLSANLIHFLANMQGVWAAFKRLPEEPSVDVEAKNSPLIQWVYPRVDGLHLQFVFANSFTVGTFGILEPQNSEPQISIHATQGILIPALAFDESGTRLGRGKGFYDRALQNYQGIKVGVAWDFQVATSELPYEEHDIKMDVVITDRRILKLR